MFRWDIDLLDLYVLLDTGSYSTNLTLEPVLESTEHLKCVLSDFHTVVDKVVNFTDNSNP
jgi:hypothetical protein